MAKAVDKKSKHGSSGDEGEKHLSGKNRPRSVRADVAFIKDYREQIRNLSGQLGAVIEEMEEKGLPEIQINGIGKADLGLEYLTTFVTYTKRGVELAKAENFRSSQAERRRRSGVE